MEATIDRIFHARPEPPPPPPGPVYYARFPNLFKTADGSAVRAVDYDYTYYPLPRHSFVADEWGVTRLTFPQTHWYAPNASRLSYRQVCMTPPPESALPTRAYACH